MRPLEAHLRQPGSHGHLPFHHGCPVCRAERLAGPSPRDEFLSARTRGALAAALLAATAIPAAPAAASEPDAEQEGSADEKETGQTGDAAPGFEEGRQDTDLPVDEGVELPASGDDGEVEQAPEHESQPQERGQDEPVSRPDTPTSGPGRGPLPPVPAPDEPPALEDLRAPSGRPLDRNESRSSPETLRRTPGPTAPLPPPAGKAPAGDAAPPSPPTGQPGSAAGPAPAADPGPVPTGEPPGALSRDPSDGRTHVVRQGECLWSIAHHQIGSDATPAQVARLVNRLWNLNRERIGTGEPDLLMVGTELRLP